MVAPRNNPEEGGLYPPPLPALSALERSALLQLMAEVLAAQWRERATTDHGQEHQTGLASGLGSLVERALRSDD